jgi:hypothetical protein
MEAAEPHTVVPHCSSLMVLANGGGGAGELRVSRLAGFRSESVYLRVCELKHLIRLYLDSFKVSFDVAVYGLQRS